MWQDSKSFANHILHVCTNTEMESSEVRCQMETELIIYFRCGTKYSYLTFLASSDYYVVCLVYPEVREETSRSELKVEFFYKWSEVSYKTSTKSKLKLNFFISGVKPHFSNSVRFLMEI